MRIIDNRLLEPNGEREVTENFNRVLDEFDKLNTDLREIKISGTSVEYENNYIDDKEILINLDSVANTNKIRIFEGNLIHIKDFTLTKNGVTVSSVNGQISIKGTATTTSYIKTSDLPNNIFTAADNQRLNDFIGRKFRCKAWDINGTYPSGLVISFRLTYSSGNLALVSNNKSISFTLVSTVDNVLTITIPSGIAMDYTFGLSLEFDEDYFTKMTEFENGNYHEYVPSADGNLITLIDTTKQITILNDSKINQTITTKHLGKRVTRLAGKTIAFLGDSISAGVGFSVSGFTRTGYAYKLKKRHPLMRVINMSVGGNTFVENTNGDILDQANTLINMSINIHGIVFDGGANDAYLSKTIGTVSTGYSATLITTEFCGAVESFLKSLMTRFVGVKMLYVMVHNIANCTGLETYVNQAKTICDKWGAAHVDLFHESGLNSYIPAVNNAMFKPDTNNPEVGDTCHPLENCYDIHYVPPIDAKLESLF